MFKGKAAYLPLVLLLLYGCGGGEESGGTSFLKGVMHQLFNEAASQPSWSPDGNDIVYVHTGISTGQDLWIVSTDGSNPHELVSLPGNDRHARWHPDPSKREIVFINEQNLKTYTLYTLDVDGGEPKQIYQTDKLQITYPSFSSDGSYIVFAVVGSGRGLKRVPVDGSEEPVQIENSDGWGSILSAECSPAEPIVAFLQYKDNVKNIFTIPVEGGKPTQLTQFEAGGGAGTSYMLTGQLFFLSWLRDGSKLVFTHSSCLNGTSSAIYFLPKDGGAPIQITDDPRTAAGAPNYLTPSMSPDGKSIVIENMGTLWIMELTKL